MTDFLQEFDATPTGSAPRERRAGSFLDEFDATPVVTTPKPTAKAAGDASAQGVAPVSAASGQSDATDQVLRSMVQNTGASIIAGWRGMSELAQGRGMEEAANAVNEELENRSYTPESERVAAVMASPWNPVNWFGKLAKMTGEAAQDPEQKRRGFGRGDVFAPELSNVSPGTAATIETAIAGAPLLLMRAGNAEKPIQGIRMTDRPVSAAETAASTAAAAEKAVLPLEEQTRRSGLLQRVGIDEARKSALTGNAKEAATDFQQSKLDNQAGNFMRAKIDQERAALTQHAENIVQDTGGTMGSDGATTYARGGAILQPLDELSQYFDREIKSLYKQADERAQGVKIDTPRLHEIVAGDQAEFLGTTEGEALLKGMKARMKSLGVAEGEGGGVTVQQAERLKQYMNNVWQPRTSKLIRGLKEAIDDDVTASAGEDIYGQARALRRMRAVTLDEPNGIGKLLDSSGPEGINRAVPVEKIADTVAGMPVDQLAHVIRTLKAVPEELQSKAQIAISEIKAHFANKILDAGAARVGQWGARDVSRYIRNNQAKLEMVFGPEELAKLGDLEEAGRILRFDQSYPGATVQEHNLVARGAMAGVRAGAAATGEVVGSALGAPGLGAAVGAAAGAKLTSRFSEAAALRSAQKRFVRLSDIGR